MEKQNNNKPQRKPASKKQVRSGNGGNEQKARRQAAPKQGRRNGSAKVAPKENIRQSAGRRRNAGRKPEQQDQPKAQKQQAQKAQKAQPKKPQKKQQKPTQKQKQQHLNEQKQELIAAVSKGRNSTKKTNAIAAVRSDRSQQKGRRGRGSNRQQPQETMRIMPLGGMKEIGKNITLLEYKDDILIIDCGFSFPEDEMFGIDVVIPDFTYLKENMAKVRGLIITHGHEDHIGGVPFLLREINVPVYASPLAMGLIKNKLKEHGLSVKEHVIHAGDVMRIGSFTVEAIHTNHSIADAFAFSIKCPAGHLVHTGDFKVDYTPLDGKRIDLSRFARLGDEGVDILMCDSTNVLRSGYTPSERIVVDSMDDIFAKTEKRIIIATFSSNIYRIKYFMEASIRHGRKIAISGRSMENVTALARELGYLDLPETAFVDIRKIGNIPDGNLTIVTTGSQGEPMSALTRMANDNHKAVKLKPGDTVVFSSSPIPGNGPAVTNVVNKLYEKKVNVIQSDIVDIHVSGHACKEELKLIHALVRPRYFIPAHGEYRHLVEHSKLAESLGLNRGNIFVLNNGDALRMTGKQAKIEPNQAPAEGILVDGYGIGDVGNVVLRDRKQLSEAGLIVIAVSIDSASNTLAANPELITRGFIYVKENMPMINQATDVVYDTIEKCRSNGNMDFNALKNALRDDMRSFIYKKTKRNPVILPVILYV